MNPTLVKGIIKSQWALRHSDDPVQKATALGLLTVHIELLRALSV